jgi:hypothetical protein
VLRHTAFFLLRPDTTPEQQVSMLKGLAHMRFQCDMLEALDCGADLFGGSRTRLETEPWTRRPRWRSDVEGPPCNYDVALMLDFADAAALEAYNDDGTHHEVGEYNASISHGELTARVDWYYEGPPRIRRGGVRHSAMFVWRDKADQGARERALDAIRGLGSAPGVESLEIGTNVGQLATDFDFIVDIHVPDKASAAALTHSAAYAEAMAAVAPVTKYEWTARLSHEMRGL